jgi:biopolymer transport protein ExbB
MSGILLQALTTAADTAVTVATGITTAAPVTQQQAITEDSFSLFSMIVKGGVMMIPLALMLVLAIYVLIERLIVLGRAAKKNDAMLSGLKDLIHKGNIDSAKAMCTALNTPEAAMLEKGLNRIGQPIQDIREAMNETAEVEIGKLEKNMGILNITGRIAPMFGFIGTIIGVIKIFYDIALAKTVEIEVISTGLYQKMITSCSGLVVGVLAFVAYHWLNTKIDKLAHRMEESRMKFLDILNEPTN